MASYERMENQFGDAKRAINYLPKNMKSHLGQAEDLGAKIATVTSAVEAGAARLRSPQTPAPAPTSAVSVDIPYIPMVLGVGAVVGLYLLLKK